MSHCAYFGLWFVYNYTQEIYNYIQEKEVFVKHVNSHLHKVYRICKFIIWNVY